MTRADEVRQLAENRLDPVDFVFIDASTETPSGRSAHPRTSRARRSCDYRSGNASTAGVSVPRRRNEEGSTFSPVPESVPLRSLLRENAMCSQVQKPVALTDSTGDSLWYVLWAAALMFAAIRLIGVSNIYVHACDEGSYYCGAMLADKGLVPHADFFCALPLGCYRAPNNNFSNEIPATVSKTLGERTFLDVLRYIAEVIVRRPLIGGCSSSSSRSGFPDRSAYRAVSRARRIQIEPHD